MAHPITEEYELNALSPMSSTWVLHEKRRGNTLDFADRRVQLTDSQAIEFRGRMKAEATSDAAAFDLACRIIERDNERAAGSDNAR
jgi:hypothetical protein